VRVPPLFKLLSETAFLLPVASDCTLLSRVYWFSPFQNVIDRRVLPFSAGNKAIPSVVLRFAAIYVSVYCELKPFLILLAKITSDGKDSAANIPSPLNPSFIRVRSIILDLLVKELDAGYTYTPFRLNRGFTTSPGHYSLPPLERLQGISRYYDHCRRISS